MKKIILLGILAALWYYNPTEAQFHTFVKDRVATEIDKEATKQGATDNPLVDMIKGLASSQLSKLAERNVKRDNYFVASMYTIDLPPKIADKDWKFIGVAGQFFPLERPEFLEKSK